MGPLDGRNAYLLLNNEDREVMLMAKVIAHRGGAKWVPENTLAAFRWAAEAGCRWIELDISLLGDGTPVIIHDETLDRTTDAHGPLDQISVADLGTIDAGRWFAPAFAGQRIPTLAQVIDLCFELGLGANLELKPNADNGAALVEATARVLEEKHALNGPWLFSSFHHETLALMAQRLPDIPRGLLYDGIEDKWREKAQARGAKSLHLDQSLIDEKQIPNYRAAGLEVYTYTLNDPKRAAELFAAGLSGVFTDDPLAFEAAL